MCFIGEGTGEEILNSDEANMSSERKDSFQLGFEGCVDFQWAKVEEGHSRQRNITDKGVSMRKVSVHSWAKE